MPLLSTIATHAAAFLVGAITGAAGAYLADRFTDQRRRAESRSEAWRAFERVEQLMPELIKEMRADLAETPTARDFFVLSDERISINTSGQYLAYYEKAHSNMQEKLSILENHGYIVDITPGNAKKYRMTEDFAVLLMSNH